MFNFQMDRGSFMAANRWAQPNGRSIIGGRIKTLCLYQPPSFYPNLRAEAEIPRHAFPALVSSSRLVSFVSLWLHFFKILITQILTTQDNSNSPSLIAGQRVYMLHMLLLPFLPIVALIVQNSGNLHDMMEYRMESVAIGLKVDGTTALGISWVYVRRYVQCENKRPKMSFVIDSYLKPLASFYFQSWKNWSILTLEMITLEKFITDLQRERAEVAFYIFTNGSQTLEMNLTTRNQAYIFVEHQLTFIPKSYLSLVSKVWLPKQLNSLKSKH